MKLTIELVPQKSHFKNVRSEVSKDEWDVLRRASYRKANYKCEVCGGVGDKHPVECHEIWDYDDKKHVQKLVGLISLCPACHEVKHIGLAGIRGRHDAARRQLADVNELTIAAAEKYIADAFLTYHARSQHEWTLDLSFLTEDES